MNDNFAISHPFNISYPIITIFELHIIKSRFFS